MTRMVSDLLLDDIAEGCLAAVLDGGETWHRFMADAEERMGLPWSEILALLNERSARATA